MAASDERIKEILARAEQEREAQARKIEADVNAQKQKKEFVSKLEAKWVADTHIIQAAVQEIVQKLEAQNVQISFQPLPARPGTVVGTAEFNGRSGNKAPSAMVFNVFETGQVAVYFDDEAENNRFQLLEATAETYKQVILTFAERLIFGRHN